MTLPLSRFLLGLVLVLVTVTAMEQPAFAEARGTTFALVVTSNRSTRLARPDLRYADDDGAKYYEMFRMLASEANVALLTTFDADSQKLFPGLMDKARPPTTENVRAVAKSLGEKVRAAAALGPVDFYFVFAGHGDVDRGKGFLELEDAPFMSDDLAALLRAIPATRSHVILDSCNAFFAIQARKPGGRHFVTSEEAQRSLAERLPGVGVFLSTSAEGNVYEWSSIQSGIFSHAVRSGLSGAADADRDGHVTYDELRAFVDVASKDVKNPTYRPQVFARGPGGRGGAAIFDLTRATGKRLRIGEGQQRLTIRDALDVPWFDLHKEADHPATLVMPERVADNGSVERLEGANRTRHAMTTEPAGEPAAPMILAALPETAAKGEARGADELFQALFAQAFGPRAYAQFLTSDTTTPPIVLGVSTDERERMRLLLKESADSARSARQLGGALTLPVGLGLGALGGLLIRNSQLESLRGQEALAATMGGLAIAGGAYVTVRSVIDIARPSLQERTYAAFSRSLALAPDTQQAQMLYAEAEQQLLAAAVSDRRHRTWTRWMGVGLVGAMGTAFAMQVAQDRTEITPLGMTLYAVPTLVGGVLFFESLFPTATERMAELWKNDPGLLRSRSMGGVQVTPFFGPGGAGITGTF